MFTIVCVRSSIYKRIKKLKFILNIQRKTTRFHTQVTPQTTTQSGNFFCSLNPNLLTNEFAHSRRHIVRGNTLIMIIIYVYTINYHVNCQLLTKALTSTEILCTPTIKMLTSFVQINVEIIHTYTNGERQPPLIINIFNWIVSNLMYARNSIVYSQTCMFLSLTSILIEILRKNSISKKDGIFCMISISW